MGSWVRTIRKMLHPQREQQHGNKKPSRRHRRQSSGVMTTTAQGGDPERTAASSQMLHGEVMACAYEDVQVMWSMLDKARICSAAAAAAS